jgi:hypothetical protein
MVNDRAASRVLSKSGKFIRVGACLQFLLVAIGLVPPLDRSLMTVIHAVDSPALREAISDAVLSWMIGAPIVGTVLYARLPSDQKAGTEGLLLLFWWICLFAMCVVAFSLGAGF